MFCIFCDLLKADVEEADVDEKVEAKKVEVKAVKKVEATAKVEASFKE